MDLMTLAGNLVLARCERELDRATSVIIFQQLVCLRFDRGSANVSHDKRGLEIRVLCWNIVRPEFRGEHGHTSHVYEHLYYYC